MKKLLALSIIFFAMVCAGHAQSWVFTLSGTDGENHDRLVSISAGLLQSNTAGTISIIPLNLSLFTNDAGFITSSGTITRSLTSGAADYAATGPFDISGAAVAVQMVSLQKSSNLSDLANTSTARSNLGLGTSSTASMSAFDSTGAAAAAQAASLQKSSNLSDLANATTARTNLGLGTSATASFTAFDLAGAAAAAQAASVPVTGGTFNGTIVNGTTTSLTLTSGTLSIMSGTNRFGLRTDSGNGGQVLLDFPGGSMAFYTTGGSPYVYLAGTVHADYLIGNVTGLTINSSGLTGVIPSGVIGASLPQWLTSGSTSIQDKNSVVWGVQPIGQLPPVGTVNTSTSYFLKLTAQTIDAGITGSQLVVAPIAQWIAAPIVASAFLDFPSISANSESTLTITVTGAVASHTPTVSVGWSAALPDGIVVKQAWVSSDNTVSIRVLNETGSSIDPSAVTCKVIVTDF